ncbi:MAG TPA: ATP-binding cassette domain-containing protein [Bacteroidia bacterium]|nr:ATP-binding cassette domain-containing protein [Bacteroidia bacterium]
MTELKERTEKQERVPQNGAIISIAGLNKAFGENKVLMDFNMELFPRENVVILGKSGAGKSVLIKCIIGLMLPDAGSIKVFGSEITKMKTSDLDKMRIRVGFLFQSNALYDSMTVRENLEFPLRRHGTDKSKKEIADMLHEALSQVGLAHTLDMMPSELSGGMRKRIALARTLILKPEIILYDEPTTGLDPITGRGISQLILDIKERYGTASIIISHDMNCVRHTADRIIVLIDGRCYAMGTYEELKRSDDSKVKQFFE